MREITDRQMKDDSGELLRWIADGETVLVTNNGKPAAVIGPPLSDLLSLLSAQGQVREALEPLSSLRSIKRRKLAGVSTAEIINDTRREW